MHKTDQIRAMFLEFFHQQGHIIIPSHSIISPDSSTLLTVAGMQPLKPQFLGSDPTFTDIHGEAKRGQHVASAQRCMRIGDLDNVGRTTRHLSLFEMLGNFSFGGYFKENAIKLAWEFLTSSDWLGLEAERIYVTVHQEDAEALQLWQDIAGMPLERIHRFGDDENFWPADAPTKGPDGPCGPCSEIYYDRGPWFGSDSWDDYARNKESDRFIEIWNLVFQQYDRQSDDCGSGELHPLSMRNIDTGMGLERLASIMQGTEDFYMNDSFAPILQRVVDTSSRAYCGRSSTSHRVVVEHARSSALMLAEGIQPRASGAGYVARKLIRRAALHLHLLGAAGKLDQISAAAMDQMHGLLPTIESKREEVLEQTKAEEASFLRMLTKGEQRLASIEGQIINGKEAFRLHETYGFPIDLQRELLQAQGRSIDEEGLREASQQGKEISRRGRGDGNDRWSNER